MASTYVNNLRLEEIGTGEQSGTWGDTTNTNLEIIGQAVAWGTRAIANASTDNITITDGALDADRCLGLKLTGGGQACTVTLLPNTSSKTWFMYNATAAALTFTCGSGANVIIPAGQTKVIATDGLGSGGVVHDLLTAVNLAGITQTAAVTTQGTLTVGVDDTGYDVKFFGATSGKSLLWDESADSLIVTGTTTLVGTTNLDVIDVDGAANFAADVTFANGADIITASAGTSNFRAGVNAGNSIASGGNYNVCVGDEAGTAISTGDDNVAVGFEAGKLVSTGTENTLIGGKAGEALSVGYMNIALGQRALENDTKGNKSVAIGKQALATQNFTTATDTFNTAVGHNAGYAVTTGVQNTLIGGLAGDALTTGGGNIAIGYEALSTEDAHGHNTAIGYQALKTLDAGANSRNVAVGYQAGLDMTTGIRNVLTGTFAGANLIAGSNNVAFGEQALTTDRNGSHSTALGHAALASQDFATAADSNNTAVGHNAGLLITTGVLNTLVGSLAGDALTVGNSNVAVGTLALTTDTKGDQSVAIGNNALSAQNFTTSVDAYNVAVGAEAGNDITTGQRNVIMGGRAGHKLTDCSHNTGIGDQALTTDTLGAKSTAVGSGALATQNFTTATNSFNTAVGYYAGVATTTGTQNTILGGLSGVALTTGTNNVLIGYSAGSSSSVDLTTGSNNIVIGGNRPSLPAGELHSILIGTVANIAGKGNNTGFISPNGGAVYQGNNSTAWSQTSDRRLKKNIVNSTIGLSEINQLQVRNFEYRTVDEVTELEGHTVIDKSGVQVGVIAQEIQAILPKCVKEESTGVLSVDPDNLTWHMVKAVQELSTALDAALARITTLEG